MASYDSEDAPMRFVTRAFKKLQCVSYDLQFFCFFEAIYEVFLPVLFLDEDLPGGLGRPLENFEVIGILFIALK